MAIKKIYNRQRILVSDDIINADDTTIDAAIPFPEIGDVIFNADLSVQKQKGLDGKWVEVTYGKQEEEEQPEFVGLTKVVVTTQDLIAGESPLEEGTLYLVYE